MNTKEGLRRWAPVIIIVIIGSLAAFWFFYQPTNDLKIYFLDVGQGDATLIKYSGQVILIDGGPDNKILQRLGETIFFGQRQIDLVILTHPHDDHFAGLVEVIKRYQVKKIITSGIKVADPAYEALINLIQNKSIELVDYPGPNELMIGDLKLRFIYPFTNITQQNFDNLNNASLVTLLSYGDIDCLLTGDAEKLVETRLIDYYQTDLQAEVLKLGHHGAETSSSEEFLKLVDPQAAIISVGQDNKYNHPALAVIRRLDRLGIKKYQTSELGTVKLKTNGHWLKLGDSCLIANCPL